MEKIRDKFGNEWKGHDLTSDVSVPIKDPGEGDEVVMRFFEFTKPVGDKRTGKQIYELVRKGFIEKLLFDSGLDYAGFEPVIHDYIREGFEKTMILIACKPAKGKKFSYLYRGMSAGSEQLQKVGGIKVSGQKFDRLDDALREAQK